MKPELPAQETTIEAYDFPPGALKRRPWVQKSHEASADPMRRVDLANLATLVAAGDLALHNVVDLI